MNWNVCSRYFTALRERVPAARAWGWPSCGDSSKCGWRILWPTGLTAERAHHPTAGGGIRQNYLKKSVNTETNPPATTVLLIDDEPQIQRMLTLTLGRMDASSVPAPVRKGLTNAAPPP